MVKGHHFFHVCPRIPIGPWFENFNLQRKLKVHIIRLRLGHATTPAYLHRIGRRDNPYCSYDSIYIGDVNQILLGCETHRNKIDRLYLNMKGKNDFPTRSDILLASLCEGGPIADFIIKHIISICFQL